MARFTVALLCLMSSVSALQGVHESLNEVAKRESMRNPHLRKRELESRAELERKLASMATPKRSLANNYNYNGNNAYGNGNNAYGNNGNSYAADNYWWDQYMEEQGIGFDITSYAVKYTQCATVQTYRDELAEDENSDTVLAAERFALFRLCPKDQCSSFSTNGCGRNYGEYLVSLDQFLVSMLEYQETRVAGYCSYCQKCAAIESAKAFWASAYNNRDYALSVAQKSYNSWYTSYLENYYSNSNNGNNGNNGYQSVDSNMAAQRYYQQVRNSGNYANQYAQNYYGNYQNSNSYSSSNSYGSASSATQQYGWRNQDMWRVQSNSQMQSSNQDAWNSMGSPAGSFYGKTILNGYYDEDGVFNQVFGYFNYNGEYVSLEDDELTWDEGLWGELPELWTDVTLDTESCSYQYAGSCYNQYDSCMQILQDQDYQEYQQYQQAQQNGGNYQYQQAQGGNQQRSTLKDFVTCVEVEPYMGQNGNQWAVNQYYQNGGGYNQNYAQQQAYNCYNGDNNCEKYNQYKQNVYKYQEQQYANRRYYIGPHCGSNSRTISLAVYSDPYCTVIDEQSSVNDILGYEPNTDGIDLFPDECMSCLRDDTTQVWYEDEEVYGLEPMCSMLYQFAGKCNKNLDANEYQASANAYSNANYNQYQAAEDEAEGDAQNNQYKQMYQSNAQALNEEAVCSFIESLASNTYNEQGEITGFDSFSSGWKSALQAPKAMDAGILAGLIITAMLAVSMGIAACVLHGALARKNIPWKPRRSKGEDPTDLARQNSGITMGRSRSGAGANPLL